MISSQCQGPTVLPVRVKRNENDFVVGSSEGTSDEEADIKCYLKKFIPLRILAVYKQGFKYN